jgi:hypothetical protein
MLYRVADRQPAAHDPHLVCVWFSMTLTAISPLPVYPLSDRSNLAKALKLRCAELR